MQHILFLMLLLGQVICKRPAFSFPYWVLSNGRRAPCIRTTGFERRVTIAFTVAANAVTILRVLYGGRDLEAAFDEDAGF